MKTVLLFAALILFGLVSCNKDKFQTIPQLKFKSKNTDLVPLNGSLRVTLEYTDKEGNKRTSLEVTATEMKFLDSKGDESSSSYQSSAPANKPAAPAPSDGGNEEDIPF